MRVPLQVLVYPVTFSKHESKVLLLKRIQKRGGFWQGVTGAPFENEPLSHAAIRELREETGFEVERVVDLGFSYSFPVPREYRHLYSDDISEIVEHVFFVETDGKTPVLSAEHDEWRWCPFLEARQMLLWEENKTALDRVYEYISNRV